MKRKAGIIAGLFFLALAFALPIQAEAASKPWYKDYTYEMNHEQRQIVLKKYKGNDKKIVVPGKTTVNGKTYTTTFEVYDKSPWAKGKNSITYIKFQKGTKMPKQASWMFYGMKKLKTVDLNSCDTSDMVWACRMFADCQSLTTLKIDKWDTSNVVDMSTMFSNCKKLKNLNVKNWDTSKLEYMQCIFDHCCSLTSLDLNKWDVSKVESMFCLFQCCCKLETLKVSKWDTGNVTYMVSVFDHCFKLRNLDVSRWDTRKVDNMWFLFYKCESLKYLDLSRWNTSKVTKMDEMFSRCFNLKSIKFGKNWNTKKVKSASAMFNCCYSLENLDLSMFDLRNAKNLTLMINRCTDLKTIKTPKRTIRKIDIQADWCEKKNGKLTGKVYPAFTNLPTFKKSVTLVCQTRTPKAKVTSVKNIKTRKIRVDFQPMMDGYNPIYMEVQCSSNKNFTDKQGKMATKQEVVVNREIKGFTGSGCTISNLKKGKTYYVRVRAVAQNGRSSTWSKIFKIKVKK